MTNSDAKIGTPYPTIQQTMEFPTRFHQPLYIRLGRVGWFGWLLLTVFIFIVNGLYFFQRASIICDDVSCNFAFALTPEIADNFRELGLSPLVWAGHILFLDALVVITYIGVATIIYLRRPAGHYVYYSRR